MVDRPRKWPLAVLATLFGIGLGQVYNGEWRKAVLLNVATVALLVVVVALILSPLFAFGAPLALVGAVAILVWAVVDAIRGSRKRSESYILRGFNRVLVYAGIVIVLAMAREAATWLLRERFVQAFRIPSEAMMPTLVVGDHVYVARGLAARAPGRGDLIVFRFPEDPSRQFIMRVVALGADVVELRDKALLVNGRPVQETPVLHIDPDVMPASASPRDNFGPYTVPRGAYFVMGDNRDNSNDSRFWGPVDPALVMGTLRGIYWSWDVEAGEPRWERVGTRPR